jgi:hypothetical protein
MSLLLCASTFEFLGCTVNRKFLWNANKTLNYLILNFQLHIWNSTVCSECSYRCHGKWWIWYFSVSCLCLFEKSVNPFLKSYFKNFCNFRDLVSWVFLSTNNSWIWKLLFANWTNNHRYKNSTAIILAFSLCGTLLHTFTKGTQFNYRIKYLFRSHSPYSWQWQVERTPISNLNK